MDIKKMLVEVMERSEQLAQLGDLQVGATLRTVIPVSTKNGLEHLVIPVVITGRQKRGYVYIVTVDQNRNTDKRARGEAQLVHDTPCLIPEE